MKPRLFALLALVFVLAPQVATAAPARAPERTIWRGYLYRNQDFRTCLGTAVVFASVMSTGERIIAPDFAKRVVSIGTPLREEFYWWNQDLLADGAPVADLPLARMPRTLVALAGMPSGGGPLGQHLPRKLSDVRLVAVEFVQPAWLAGWARFMAMDKVGPYASRPRDRTAANTKLLRKRLGVGVELLRAMRAVPAATKQQRARVRAIDENARVEAHWRRQTEFMLVRWLRDARERCGVKVDLAEFGPTPPRPLALRKLLLAHKTKAEFLAAVARAWQGSLVGLELAYYTAHAGGTGWATVSVADVNLWSDEKYSRERATTVNLTREHGGG